MPRFIREERLLVAVLLISMAGALLLLYIVAFAAGAPFPMLMP
jgi:hypothetical protein